MSSQDPFYADDCVGSKNLGGMWTHASNLEAKNYTQQRVNTIKYMVLPMSQWNLAFQRGKQIKYNWKQNPIF